MKKAGELIPVSSICTKGRIGEFLITKFSLEQYHRCRWVVAVDAESQRVLSEKFPEDHWLLLVDGEGSHIKHEFGQFMKVVMNKMTIMRECISRYGRTLFVDSDLLFSGPLDPSDLWRSPIAASDHHITKQDIVDKYGKYNVGFIACSSTHFIDEWEYRTRLERNTDALEQKPFELSLYDVGVEYSVLPERYNVGWWRGFHDHAQFLRFALSDEQGVLFAEEPVVNFHLHLDPKVARDEDRQYAALVRTLLTESARPEHKELLAFVDQTIPNSLLSGVPHAPL